MRAEFCPRCGSARIGDLRFCRQCGFDFDGLPPSPDEAALERDDEEPGPEVGRLRAFISPWVLQAGLGIGLLIGGSLGLATDRGYLGLATVVGAIVGAGIGLYVGQVLVVPGNADDS